MAANKSMKRTAGILKGKLIFRGEKKSGAWMGLPAECASTNTCTHTHTVQPIQYSLVLCYKNASSLMAPYTVFSKSASDYWCRPWTQHLQPKWDKVSLERSLSVQLRLFWFEESVQLEIYTRQSIFRFFSSFKFWWQLWGSFPLVFMQTIELSHEQRERARSSWRTLREWNLFLHFSSVCGDFSAFLYLWPTALVVMQA